MIPNWLRIVVGAVTLISIVLQLAVSQMTWYSRCFHVEMVPIVVAFLLCVLVIPLLLTVVPKNLSKYIASVMGLLWVLLLYYGIWLSMMGKCDLFYKTG